MTMIREVVLDTETTGFEPSEGHRMVEIGCVELLNYVATGRVFHTYLNPGRDVPADAVRVHGITTEFLKDKPLFTEKVGDFIDFIGDSQLIIHNAEFDMKFINAELKSSGFKQLPMTRATDTVQMARKKFPGQPANLDSLCRRFKIDLSDRKFHGALLDANLLAEVYLELMGGRQQGFNMTKESTVVAAAQLNTEVERQDREKRSFPPTAEELAAHDKLVASMKESVWKKGAGG